MGTGSVFSLVFKAIFSGLFNIGNKDWIVAGKELISKKTFRLPDSSYSDRFIGLRILRRTFSSLKCKKNFDLTKHKILVIDANWKVLELRKEYIISLKGYSESEIIGLTKDVSFAHVKNGSIKFYLILLSFFVLPFTFFSKKRVQWALILSEFIEISAALNTAIRAKVERVHFFSPAEKDANLAYLIIKRAGIKVTKHPSPGALISHNENLMADTLAFSSNYQKEEYEIKLKETIKISVTEFWPPEISFKYLNLYREKKNKFECRFGFYSHGGWIRVKDGKTNGLFAKPEEEEKCLQILGDFMKIFPNEKLIVFLHPKEKGNAIETEKYYCKWLNKEQIVYYTENLPSSYVFYKAEYGIGSYSTILFERDYFGFKTLLLNEDERDFPLKGTKFHLNSFKSSVDLLEKVNNYIS